MSKSLFITDLDGTLLGSDGRLAQRDIDALVGVVRDGVTTAVATGRSLHSFMNSSAIDLDVDYIIFTTGAGVVTKAGYELIYQLNLSAEMVTQTLETLSRTRLDFMLQQPLPDNHHFLYRRANQNNIDF